MPYKDKEVAKAHVRRRRPIINARKRVVYAQRKSELNAVRRWWYQVDGDYHEYIKGYARKRHADIRAEMLTAYGCVCVCCGESREPFMTLDHFDPNDKGVYRHRKDGKSGWLRGFQEYYRLQKLGWPKKSVRILCMNCNHATRRGGVCPHERERKEHRA